MLYEGITLTTLNKGPGHWPGTAPPSQDGNVVVRGTEVTHSRPFRNIDTMGPGDEVIFHDRLGPAHLHVRPQRDRSPDGDAHRAADPGQDGDDIACLPPGSARFRFVVHLTYVGSVTV